MAYTRDWDEASPLDHTKFKVQPSHVRDFKVDVADRLKNLVAGFTAGETEEGFKKIPYLVQGTAPSSASNMILGFGSDVAAKCELFLLDEDGHVIQVTSGGKVKAGILGTKEIDETDIADRKIIRYDDAAGKLQYEGPLKKTLLFFVPDTVLATGVNKSAEILVPCAATIKRAWAIIKTAPTGASLIIDININGSTIWATQGNRLTIVASATAGDQSTFDSTAVAADDIITVDIDQIGSSVAGGQLTIGLEIEE